MRWVNQHYIKLADNERLATWVEKNLNKRGITVSDTPALTAVIELYKGRTATLVELGIEAAVFYSEIQPDAELLSANITAEVLPALHELAERFASVAWEAPAVAATIKELLAKHNLKMPKLAMPVRVMLVGQTHTPSVDAVITLFTREVVLQRMKKYL